MMTKNYQSQNNIKYNIIFNTSDKNPSCKRSNKSKKF